MPSRLGWKVTLLSDDYGVARVRIPGLPDQEWRLVPLRANFICRVCQRPLQRGQLGWRPKTNNGLNRDDRGCERHFLTAGGRDGAYEEIAS